MIAVDPSSVLFAYYFIGMGYALATMMSATSNGNNSFWRMNTPTFVIAILMLVFAWPYQAWRAVREGRVQRLYWKAVFPEKKRQAVHFQVVAPSKAVSYETWLVDYVVTLLQLAETKAGAFEKDRIRLVTQRLSKWDGFKAQVTLVAPTEEISEALYWAVNAMVEHQDGSA